MGKYARIEPGGYISIDHTAWLNQRTLGILDDLTADLRQWVQNPTGPHARMLNKDMSQPSGKWRSAALIWCLGRSYEMSEPDVIVHSDTRLDENLWVVRFRTQDLGALIIVGIDDDLPTVRADLCSDSWDWFDSDSVEIFCRAGHGWTWRSGRELITADGSFTTLTAVFGTDLDAPFTPCPMCTAYRDGTRTTPCGCDRSPWIACPTCGSRCDVELPTY